jgi:nucleoside-diphosphate-sugar epimerase
MAGHFLETFLSDARYNIRLFNGDITKKEDCVRNLRDADTVINFAALTYLPPSWSNAGAYTKTNYQGVVNLLDCHDMFSRFIQISTSHVYGTQYAMPIQLGVNEPQPQDPYSIAKLAAEKAVVGYSDKYGFDYLIIRPFNNFGPRQSKHFVIPSFINQALNTHQILVRGDTKREFVYVKDNVRAIKHFLDSGASGYRQVCQGKSYQISDVAVMIARAVAPECNVAVGKSDRPHDIPELWGEPTLPEGFKFTPMEQALAETVAWYREMM